MQQQSRTNQFIKNVIGSALLQIVTIVTGFISPKLMLNAFGSEINGIVSSITQFISYITLVEAGLANAVVFALYKPLADKDNEVRDSIASAARISYNRVGVLFVILSVGLALIYPFIGNTTILNYWELFALVLVLCMQTAANFFILARYRAILTADQCGYWISLVSSIQLIVHLVLVYITIQLNLNVIWVRGLSMMCLALTAVLLAIILKCKYGHINFKSKPNMKALDKRWEAMTLQIIGVIQSGAPVIIMTRLLDFKTISVYTIYNMIAGSVSQCISVFTSGLGSSFGNVYATGDKALLKKTTEEFRTAYYLVLTIMYTTMLVMIMPFVSIYTSDITDANYILPILGILITLRGWTENISAPYGMLVFSEGKFKVVRRQYIVKTVIVVVLGIAFNMLWGIYGLIAALCVANVYALIENLYITPKHLVEMSLPKAISQIVISGAVLTSGYFISRSIGYVPAGYLEWVIYACIVVLCTSLVTVPLYYAFYRKEMSAIWQRLMNLLRRMKIKSR